MHSKELVNKHGDATKPALLLACCFWRFYLRGHRMWTQVQMVTKQTNGNHGFERLSREAWWNAILGCDEATGTCSNLVDSASSHTLVSKIKPCMCKYKILYRNCGRLIISVIVYLIIPHYLDNRSNSRANICIKAELSGTAVFISIKPSLFGVDLVSHNNLSNCMHMLRQWIIQVSALSAWDGSVLDYHGFNG